MLPLWHGIMELQRWPFFITKSLTLHTTQDSRGFAVTISDNNLPGVTTSNGPLLAVPGLQATGAHAPSRKRTRRQGRKGAAASLSGRGSRGPSNPRLSKGRGSSATHHRASGSSESQPCLKLGAADITTPACESVCALGASKAGRTKEPKLERTLTVTDGDIPVASIFAPQAAPSSA